MRRRVNEWLEMAARVRAFSRTHPSADPEYAMVLGRLEERLARAEAIAGRQFEGLKAARSARSRRGELRRVVHTQLLRYLVRVGEVAVSRVIEFSPGTVIENSPPGFMGRELPRPRRGPGRL